MLSDVSYGLLVENLSVSVDTKQIISCLTLNMPLGSTHVVMGPNGSGKSTLASAIAGLPPYEVTAGKIGFMGQEVSGISIHERACKGMLLTFQNPPAIPGLSVQAFLQAMLTAYGYRYSPSEFRTRVEDALSLVGLPVHFLERCVNEGFSGGERKRFELAQAILCQPRLLILDEIDSGLDVDALRCIYTSLQTIKKKCPDLMLLCITHYTRLLEYIQCDVVHIMKQGSFVYSGGREVAQCIDNTGYRQWQ